MTASIATNQTILVVGGGIAGMTAALEAAECGKQVILAEKSPTLGGRTSMLYRYFPKMCFPSCGLEINLKRVRGNPNVRVMTMTEVAAVTGIEEKAMTTTSTNIRRMRSILLFAARNIDPDPTGGNKKHLLLSTVIKSKVTP